MAKLYRVEGGRKVLIAEICNRCYDIATANGQSDDEIAAILDGNGRDRFRFGIYAGHYCLEHWRRAGYKDEGPSGFDPLEAGERLEEEDP